MGDVFKQRLEKLTQELEKAKKGLDEGCAPMLLVAGAAIPVLTFLCLYFIDPGFVNDEKDQLSVKKVLIWTTIITVVSWALIGAYAYHNGMTGSFLCYKS